MKSFNGIKLPLCIILSILGGQFLLALDGISPSSGHNYHSQRTYCPIFGNGIGIMAPCNSTPVKFYASAMTGLGQKSDDSVNKSGFSAGRFGNALVMKGYVEPYLTIPNQTNISPGIFAVSFWIYVDPALTSRDNSSIISHVNTAKTAGWYFALKLKPELHVEFSVADTDGIILAASAPIQPSKFVNILGSFDGKAVKIYSDGVLAGEKLFSGEYQPKIDVPFIVGLSSYRESTGLKVLIDDLRIYSKALSGPELKYILNKNQTMREKDLIGYWPFDDGVKDMSANKNDGTLDKHPVITYDKLGIPIIDYGEINGTFIGSQRNPITASATAIEAYSKYKQNQNETYKEQVLHIADWLISNLKSRDGYSVLEYQFPWPTYHLPLYWVSGMAHGLAIRAFIYAHQLVQDEKYLDAAKRLLNSFFVDVSDGGVTHKDSESAWWYEEYASRDGDSPRVLNGMMYTLLGIHEYYEYTNDTSAKYLFDKGISSLVTNLPTYDDPKYSYSFYDSLHTTNTLFYHKVHLDLLDKLYKITGIGVLKYYHDRWENFTPPPFIARCLEAKTC